MSEGRISLKVKTEVSELSPGRRDPRSATSRCRPSRSAAPKRRSSCPPAVRWFSAASSRTTSASRSPACPASAICRSSARCSAAATSSATRPSWSSSSRPISSSRCPHRAGPARRRLQRPERPGRQLPRPAQQGLRRRRRRARRRLSGRRRLHHRIGIGTFAMQQHAMSFPPAAIRRPHVAAFATLLLPRPATVALCIFKMFMLIVLLLKSVPSC